MTTTSITPITSEGQSANLTIEHDRNLTTVTVATPDFRYPFRILSFVITNHAVATNDPDDIFITLPEHEHNLTLAEARLYAAALTEALAQAARRAAPAAEATDEDDSDVAGDSGYGYCPHCYTSQVLTYLGNYRWTCTVCNNTFAPNAPTAPDPAVTAARALLDSISEPLKAQAERMRRFSIFETNPQGLMRVVQEVDTRDEAVDATVDWMNANPLPYRYHWEDNESNETAPAAPAVTPDAPRVKLTKAQRRALQALVDGKTIGRAKTQISHSIRDSNEWTSFQSATIEPLIENKLVAEVQGPASDWWAYRVLEITPAGIAALERSAS